MIDPRLEQGGEAVHAYACANESGNAVPWNSCTEAHRQEDREAFWSGCMARLIRHAADQQATAMRN